MCWDYRAQEKDYSLLVEKCFMYIKYINVFFKSIKMYFKSFKAPKIVEEKMPGRPNKSTPYG